MTLSKIIIFTTDLYQGGIASATAKYAASLTKEFNVVVVVWDNLPINKKLPKSIKIYQLNCPLGANFGKTKNEIIKRKFLRLFLLPWALISFLFILKREKPDYVFSLGYLPNLASILISRKRNIKTIVSERTFSDRDLEKTGLKGKVVISLSKYLYHKADLILTPSKQLKDYIKLKYKISNDKLVNIPNYFDLELIKNNTQEMLSPEHQSIFNSNVIITCGRLSRQKGQWFLIRSVAQLLKESENWNLVFLGDGEMLNELKELVLSLEIAKKVHFLGNVSNPHKYIASSKIFIFPSLWEGFPNALVEAMACNIAVVSADCPTGPREILPDNGYPNDFFIEQLPNEILTNEPLINQEKDLQKAIKTLMENKDLRFELAQKAVKISNSYSIQEIEDKLFECIRTINI